MTTVQTPLTKVLLIILIIVSALWAVTESPQGLMFTLLFLVILSKETLKQILTKLSRASAFILTGLTAGLLIEVFAIFQNWSLADSEKILLHPDPAIDLFLACLWYGLFTCTWYLILRKYSFTKRTVYVTSSLFGLFTEQGGAYLIGIFAQPLVGSLLALLVTAAYGIFPLIAYLLTEERFTKRQIPKLKHYLYLALTFFFFWAVFGNIIYDSVNNFFL